MIRILFASRLVHEKWVDILMDCIEQYEWDPALAGEICWDICSDGDARAEIESLSTRYPNVTYHGRLNAAELKALYEQVDILFMPSRFLEMFGLTALEALALGTPVCAPAKGGLRLFVTPELTLDESRPVDSFADILVRMVAWEELPLPDIGGYSGAHWTERLAEHFRAGTDILIVHDYEERIGWAEYYVESVRDALQTLWKKVSFYGYRGHTTPWKRRIMFVLSIFAFWRGIELYTLLQKGHIDTIWMHSVLRYIGPWWVLAVRLYSMHHPVQIYLSHHDLGLLAAFPQDITEESDIPLSPSLRDFIPDASMIKKITSLGKWCYVRIITALLPDDITHVIFAPFLEQYIRGQFGEDTQITIFPHQSIVGT